MDDGGNRAPSSFETPPLASPAQARYQAAGDFRTLSTPGLLSTANTTFSEGEQLILRASTVELPNATGEVKPTLRLQAHRPGQPPFWVVGAQQGVPLLEFIPARHEVYTSGPPSAQVRYTYGLGPMDLFLFANRTLEQDATSLDALNPRALSSWHPVQQAHLEDVVRVRVAPSDDPVPVRVSVHVNISELAGSDASTPERVGQSLVFTPRIQDNVTATYTLTPGCPFPATVRYAEPEGIRFEAQRLSCTTGAPQQRPESPLGPAWPREGVQTYERSFPGDGERLPLPYRDALTFFLRQPDVVEFTRTHPDWFLQCAVLEQPGPQRTAYHDWRWWFNVTDGTDAIQGWTTQLTGGPTGATPVEGAWSREPAEMAGGCGGSSVERFEQRPNRYAPVEDFHEAFEALLPSDRWRGEAEWIRLELNPEGTSILLSKCRAQERTGFCGEINPDVRFGSDGSVRGVLAPASWLGVGFGNATGR